MAKEISIDDLVGSKNTKLKAPKQQKEQEMKTNSSKKTIVVSVISTLAVLAAIVAVFYTGFNAGVQYEKGRQDVIVQEAAKLSNQLKEKSEQ